MILAVMPLPSWLGHLRPDFVALVVIYWCMALPNRINVGVGWIAGIMMDILTGTLLGQHALAYSVIAYVTVKLHKQIRIYPLWQQALSIFTLVALSQLLIAWIRGITGESPDSWLYWLPSVTSAMLWPWLYIVMRNVRRKFRVS